VIGDGGSSSREQHEKKKIMDSVDQAGIRDRVRFLGYQSHDVLIREFYRNDVFVSPSVTSDDGDTEGGAPVTIIEAAASGMPVASTTHCDIPFVLSPENRQYLAPERDSEALARAIWSLFESSDWSTLLDANRSLVERELMLITQANRLAQIYRRVATETDALGMAAVA
jgi:colanic acid/amylovoran biosynthesis glycosyltransferase